MATRTKKTQKNKIQNVFKRFQKPLPLVVVALFAVIGLGLTWRMLAATANEVIPDGGPSWNFDIARTIRVNPNGKGAIIMDGNGGMHSFKLGKNGVAPRVGANGPYWKGWDIARDFVITDWNKGAGYILDGWGGIHSFGGAPAPSKGPYWSGKDLARKIVVRSDQKGGYVLDAYGGIHAFAMGSAPEPPAATGGPYWKGWDIARGIALNPSNTGGYVLDGYGGIQSFAIGGNAKPAKPSKVGYYNGKEAGARDFVVTDWNKASGFVLEKNGNLFAFGETKAIAGTSKSSMPYRSLATVNGLYYAMSGNGVVLTSSPPNALIFNDAQIQYFKQLEEARRQQEAQATATANALQQLLNSCYQQTLRQGSTGACVKVLQNVINGLSGSNLAVDGAFGPATAGAVKNYQCGVGLSADGIVGPQTWGAIKANKRGNRVCGGGSSGGSGGGTSNNGGGSSGGVRDTLPFGNYPSIFRIATAKPPTCDHYTNRSYSMSVINDSRAVIDGRCFWFTTTAMAGNDEIYNGNRVWVVWKAYICNVWGSAPGNYGLRQHYYDKLTCDWVTASSWGATGWIMPVPRGW